MRWLRFVLCIAYAVSSPGQASLGRSSFVQDGYAHAEEGVQRQTTPEHCQGLVTFSYEGGESIKSIHFMAPNRQRYILLLKPDLDINRHVVEVDLILHRSSKRTGRNLLEPLGAWHGYQPFKFAALDFARANMNAFLSNSVRSIDIPKAGMRLQIKVADVGVRRTSPRASTGLPYEFTSLKLAIATQSL